MHAYTYILILSNTHLLQIFKFGKKNTKLYQIFF